MQRYILIWVLQAIFVLFAVSIIVFALVRASGNPLILMLPLDAEPKSLEILAEHWGLDQPYHIQYWRFISNSVQGDFGDSFKWPGHTAIGLVSARLVTSLQLILTALILAEIMAVILGVITVAVKDTPLDFVGKIFALTGVLWSRYARLVRGETLSIMSQRVFPNSFRQGSGAGA
jgi:peptide/nickel transport system permease protein